MNASPRQSLNTISLCLVIAGFAAIGLVMFQSLLPNKQATEIHAWLEIPISEIPDGSYKVIKWIGWPIVVYRPDRAAMVGLRKLNPEVWGPPVESLELPNAVIYVALSTHSGCALVPISAEIDRSWPPGWMDPCTMGAWDLAGRSFKKFNVPPSVRLDNLRKLNFEVRNNDTIAIHR